MTFVFEENVIDGVFLFLGNFCCSYHRMSIFQIINILFISNSTLMPFISQIYRKRFEIVFSCLCGKKDFKSCLLLINFEIIKNWTKIPFFYNFQLFIFQVIIFWVDGHNLINFLYLHF